MRNLRQHFWGGMSLTGGAFAALIPAAILSISATQFPAEAQGLIALALAISAFCAQLSYAAVIEARLSSVGTLRNVVMPRWLTGASLIATASFGIFFWSPWVLCCALPFVLSGLEVGRGASLAERLDRREVVAAGAIGLGAIGGVVANLLALNFGLAVLASGLIIAIAIRSKEFPHKPSKPTKHAIRWVLIDTAVSGVTFPLLSVVIFRQLGPVDVFLFSTIATVSGLLAIPLTFLRMRLLKQHSIADVGLSIIAVLGGFAALVLLELTGFFNLVFGAVWTIEVTIVPLLVASLWRAASFLTTMPFVALRRSGAVKLLTWLRALVALITFAAALIGLSLGSLAWVFSGLLLAELISAAIFESVRRRRARLDLVGISE